MAFFNDNNNQKDDEYDDDDDADEDDEAMDMEINSTPEILQSAREQFELMMSIPSDNQESSHDPKQEIESESASSSISMDEEERYNHGTRTISKAVLSNRNSPPPLTAILRERRLTEIELLKSLHTSDKAVKDLWSLWISERGAEAASNILHAEELIAVESWTEAEIALLALIEEHGIHWAEPVNRLATLYYMLGRYEEAKALCELVLDIKPWHFGALSGIVLVCTAKNDASGARFWAEKRLPPAGDRRVLWTTDAIEKAEQSLHEASLVGRNRDIGQEEIQFRQLRAQLEEHIALETNMGYQQLNDSQSDDDDDDSGSFDAWQ